MKLRDLWAAVSLTNIIYVRIWAELLATSGPSSYSLLRSATPAHYSALISNIALLALVVWCVIPGHESTTSSRSG